jgi:hypothetical protein
MIVRTASVVACDDCDWLIGFELTLENKTIHECAQLCALEFVKAYYNSLASQIVESYVDVTVKVTGDVPESRNVVRVSLKTEVINPRDGAE